MDVENEEFSPSTQEEEEEEEIEEWGGEEEDEEESETDVHSLQKEDFFGCYLLVSKNPKFKGRTYIGYTVNPTRRIRQHNAGSQKGGAKRTSGRGPWEMVLIVHGFPNDVSALRFEWAWQHPAKSRRLGTGIGPGKRSRESSLEHKFRILSEMLSVTPWKRLPLTVRWLIQEHQLEFPLDRQPPTHMPIAYGPVELSSGKRSGEDTAKKTGSSQGEGNEVETEETSPDTLCSICHQTSESGEESSLLSCYHTNCSLTAHLTCLAERICPPPLIIPTVGPCPSCTRELLWGEMIRRRKRKRP